MKKWFITCNLVDGINYFCGFQTLNNIPLIEWDTDFNYAKAYNTKKEAEKDFESMKAQKDETWKIESLIVLNNQNSKLN